MASFDVRTESVQMNCGENQNSGNHSHNAKELVHKVQDCSRKIRITVTLNSKDKQNDLDTLHYYFVDNVTDLETGKQSKLLNPLLVRLKQEQLLLAYPIKYLSAVNGRASETVINYENRKNFTGCDDESPVNPTCGVKHLRGEAVPFSQGFCCFCPETTTKGIQARGGQDCSIEKPPADNINLMAYRASAHCLRQSPVWYTVNDLERPNVMHQIFMQVYVQKHLSNGSSQWFAITGDEDYAIGTQTPYEFNENKTIVLTYATEKPQDSSINIKYEDVRLLVPQPLDNSNEEAVKKGATDYLLMPKDLINPDGDECDKAGISFEGFSLQKGRCDVPRNSCLKNQPLDFWDKDNAARKTNGKGTYLLENYGTPYKDPIVIDRDTKEHWLTLEYYQPHNSLVYVETVSDHIITLHAGRDAQIISIITSSSDTGIDFMINVRNSGLVSAEFTVITKDCGYSVPDTAPETLVVPPQHMSTFTLSTKVGSMQLSDEFSCTVELTSSLYGSIASREALIKPKKRCICNYHCECVCLGDTMFCYPMSEEDYHRAGFRGSLPILTAKPPYKSWFSKNPLLTLLAIFSVLMLLGLAKAVFGCMGFFPEFGLRSLLYKRTVLDHYTQSHLADREVEYADGYPIHPDTGERMKFFRPIRVFVLNVFICFIWPFIIYVKCKRTDYQLVAMEDQDDQGNVNAPVGQYDQPPDPRDPKVLPTSNQPTTHGQNNPPNNPPTTQVTTNAPSRPPNVQAPRTPVNNPPSVPARNQQQQLNPRGPINELPAAQESDISNRTQTEPTVTQPDVSQNRDGEEVEFKLDHSDKFKKEAKKVEHIIQ